MNKFMKKLMKKSEGFTLVELIVVIAILAILAGIAIPAYSGYLKSANKAADITALSAVKTAVQGAHATATMPTYIKVVDGATDAITVGTSDSDDAEMTGDVLDDFKTFMNIAADGSFAIALKSGSTAEWVNGEWTISGTPYTP